jgi:hypothetical protein
MIRPTQLGLALLIAGLILLLKGSSPLVTTVTAKTQTNASAASNAAAVSDIGY